MDKLRESIFQEYVKYRELDEEKLRLYPSQIKSIYDFIDRILPLFRQHMKVKLPEIGEVKEKLAELLPVGGTDEWFDNLASQIHQQFKQSLQEQEWEVEE